MTRRRWIADGVGGNHAFIAGEQAAHLARVLRARVEQEVEIAAGGRVRLARITAVSAERVELELGDDVPVRTGPDVVLLLAIFKFDRMEWAIEKATELGVNTIVPVMAERSEKHLAAAAVRRVERWRRIAREAAQQSRRAEAPEVADPGKLKDALASGAGTRIVLAESGADRSLKQALGGAVAPVALAVGPEGGWTDGERRDFAEAGWTAASLGPSILRVETAVVAALAIVLAEVA